MFSQRFHLINQECYLIESMIYGGLSDLRKANLGDQIKYFYSSLFGLSIGFERTMKLILIVDYILKNSGNNPPSNYTKSLGHNLVELKNKCNVIALDYGYINTQSAISINAINNKIFEFLDRFARITRYENLNRLTSGQQNIDPLLEWKELVDIIDKSYFTDKQRLKIEQNGLLFNSFDGGIFVIMTDLDKSELNHKDFGRLCAAYDIAVRYIIWDLCKIIEELKNLLARIWDESHLPKNRSFSQDFPFLNEFLISVSSRKEFSYSKKRWP